MHRADEQIITERHQFLGYALVILPAVSLGVLAMLCASVSPMLWGQQAAAWMIFALLAWPLRRAIPKVSASLLSTAVVICVQPDLSQLVAFSVAVLPLLWQRRNERLWTAACVLSLAAFAIRCLLVPVSVAPVECCEGILTMLGEVSPLLLFAGVIALAVIPVWFAYRFFRRGGLHLLSLAVYYAISLLFVLPGEYPVPFMGFGLSSIAGYFLALAII